jgi:LacI family transcriptional regulator
MMKTRRHVALIIETSNDYARGLLRGIRAYIRERNAWVIYLGEHSRGESDASWLANWRGDGIIARIENQKVAQAVMRAGLPVVDVSAARCVPELPWVETNDEVIARLAIDHLLERGFKHFGFCGDPRFNWSKWRCQSFTRLAQEAGYDCSVYESPGGNSAQSPWVVERDKMAEWVRSLPKPVGVMACYDIRGQQLLEACHLTDVVVPDEVAVIGVDNDPLLCALADPPLSSVIPNSHRTGYQAAVWLDHLMAGEPLETQVYRIEPLGIAERLSTDVLAIDDQEVSEAVRFIRHHACEDINVNDVLKIVPLSRRVLEKRFREALHRTPHDEILRVKLARVRELLTETELPLSMIAERAGFNHIEYMSVAFKKEFGIPPSQYRVQNKY